jgi:hypothetical protein
VIIPSERRVRNEVDDAGTKECNESNGATVSARLEEGQGSGSDTVR